MSERIANDGLGYLEHYPNAIQNKDLAYTMAVAGDPHESEAVRLRQHGERQLRETIVKDPGAVAVFAAITMNTIVPKINREMFAARQKYAELEMKPYDFAADAFDALEATRR